MRWLLVLIVLVPAIVATRWSSRPGYELTPGEVQELELTGLARHATRRVAGPATVVLWVRSSDAGVELDVRTSGGLARALVAQPTGETRAVIFGVEDGTDVRAAIRTLGGKGAASLCLHEIAESAAARAAVAAGREALAAARGAQPSDELATALLATVERVLALNEAIWSAASFLWDFGMWSTAVGRSELARQAWERVVAAHERFLPASSDLASSCLGLSLALERSGELEEALVLARRALDEYARMRPAADAVLGGARRGVARLLAKTGRRVEARTLFDEQLAFFPDDEEARANLGSVLFELGDWDAAGAYLDEMVAHYEATRAENDRDLLGFLGTMAAMRGAPEHFEQLHARAVATFGEDDPLVTHLELNWGVKLKSVRDDRGALELLQRVLARRVATRGEEDESVAIVRFNLAEALFNLGDDGEARRQLEQALYVRERLLPPGHSRLLETQAERARLAALDGDRELLAELLARMTEGCRTLVHDAIPLSRRERADVLRAIGGPATDVLGLSLGLPDPVLDRAVFEMAESMRALGSAGPLLFGPADEPLRELYDELLRKRRQVGPGREIEAAALGRDRAERDLIVELERRGLLPSVEVDLEALAAALPAGAAAISYRVNALGLPRGVSAPSGSLLLVHVVRPDGTLAFEGLGEIGEVRDLIGRWRAAIGEPLDGARTRPNPRAEEALGRRLFERILAPALAHTGEATTLFVAVDGSLHVLPLDALPLGRERVGDALDVRQVSSLAALVRERPRLPRAGQLVAVGDVDFGARRGARFEALRATQRELESVVRLYDARTPDGPGGPHPIVLSGKGASRDAFCAAAPGARYLHVATHGWFEAQPDRAVAAFGPLTLCGLAFAGANGDDAAVVLAEELAGLDLSRCRLAVLSACETHVGLHAAGQGIWSLHTALHMAGARASLTSLWRVRDERTRELMSAFYEHLWSAGGSGDPHRALLEAKRELRARRLDTRDWAGWVLVGAPE